ncbi:hypothetical protein NE237_017133 [Protea cynaroides]|uniref:Uncharacterized protein n=1 Tax=Protea cynaroides TaxID=273540 RepID=A0A9Q0K7G1_9MAGN|nr:hypothetical protein NE237_017133 [Protea cynaroides]
MESAKFEEDRSFDQFFDATKESPFVDFNGDAESKEPAQLLKHKIIEEGASEENEALNNMQQGTLTEYPLWRDARFFYKYGLVMYSKAELLEPSGHKGNATVAPLAGAGAGDSVTAMAALKEAAAKMIALKIFFICTMAVFRLKNLDRKELAPKPTWR